MNNSKFVGRVMEYGTFYAIHTSKRRVSVPFLLWFVVVGVALGVFGLLCESLAK